ncbi:DUF4142 domain-containing protein [Aquincola sp. S2]|uniref:DUF4142 domain-containing protein n=1 Tax=Pseudaquabacterium terrae TaxID=2732868 RepID=A0ABX2EAQ9_9BURK|nr:DUF4142 domain-containing protein [Aquabacterium terrae]NRF66186.1 DUF4142 domain-containing protein [Aquabacterium terrae]
MRGPLHSFVHAAGVFALLVGGFTAAQAASALTRADGNFMKEAAQAGQVEVEASKIALQRARHTQVRAFAQQMVDDHGKVQQELVALAALKSLKLQDKPSVAARTGLKLLATADEAKFDERYAKSYGVRAHRDAVALFQKAANRAVDPEVRAFAAKTLPVLQQHLTQAEDMRQAVERDAKASLQSAAASAAAPKR